MVASTMKSLRAYLKEVQMRTNSPTIRGKSQSPTIQGTTHVPPTPTTGTKKTTGTVGTTGTMSSQEMQQQKDMEKMQGSIPASTGIPKAKIRTGQNLAQTDLDLQDYKVTGTNQDEIEFKNKQGKKFTLPQELFVENEIEDLQKLSGIKK